MEIGTGAYGQDTEFMFADKYFALKKNGSFGWTRLTYVADLAKPAKAGPSFGLWGQGLFWIDNVSMERVGSDAKLTAAPELGKEGGAHRAAGRTGTGRGPLPPLRLSQYAGMEEVLRLRESSWAGTDGGFRTARQSRCFLRAEQPV